MAPTEERHLRPFGEFLASARKGKLAAELAVALSDLLLAVDECDKGGSLTLTLSAKPIGKGSGAIELTDKIVTKLPEASKPATIVFADADGNPVRNDPRQPEIEGLREVPPAATTTPDGGTLKEAK